MAYVDSGVKVSLGSAIVPSGVTLSTTLNEFQDYMYTRALTLDIVKATVDEATATATFKAIIENGAEGIQFQVKTIMEAEFDDGNKTVSTWIEFLGISNNQGVGLKSDFYTNAAPEYKVSIKLYIKVA